MRALLISTILLLSYSLNGLAQSDSLGFTNKAEAKNLFVNGKKEGKWIEPLTIDDSLVSESYLFYYYYRLAIYKNGKLSGITHKYTRSDVLTVEANYFDGKLNGDYKFYWPNGNVRNATPYVNDTINGVVKEYYENGDLERETPYTKGIKGETKYADELRIPAFLKITEQWTIRNNSDSLEVLNLDTLKLSESSCNVKNSTLFFSIDRNSFDFCTNGRIDTLVDELGNPKTVGTCKDYRSGNWVYDFQSNTLKLYFNNKNNRSLSYNIQCGPRQDVFLIRKK